VAEPRTEAGLARVADIGRNDIQDYKVWLAAQPRAGGRAITAETRLPLCELPCDRRPPANHQAGNARQVGSSAGCMK
jgi:hypothetical protein